MASAKGMGRRGDEGLLMTIKGWDRSYSVVIHPSTAGEWQRLEDQSEAKRIDQDKWKLMRRGCLWYVQPRKDGNKD
jgi:hypothetical protein